MFEDIGEYKNSIGSLLKNDDKICRLLLGEDYEVKFDDIDAELDKYIKPHLYVDGVVTETKSFIMYEIKPYPSSPTIKDMKVIIQVISHKDAVEYKLRPKGYSGLRYDILARYVEEVLCPVDKNKEIDIKKKFGIGSFEMKSPDLFLSREFIGRVFTLTVPDFK